jgi:chromosome segregation ATPase
MKGARPWQLFLAIGAMGLFSGCLFASKTKLNDAQAQCRILSQQNSAQLTEIENLNSHGKVLENKLIRSDEEIALLKEQVDLDRRQMANYEREHNELYEQFKALARDRVQQTSPDAGTPQTGNSNPRTVR